MKSLVHALILAVIVLFSGFAATAAASPPSPVGVPIVAQYSGNTYGGSSSNSSSTSTGYRSYRGLFRIGAFVIFLIVSAVGYLIRKLSGE